MHDNNRSAGDRDTFLETFAAKLTEAAYPVALRHGVGGSWVDLELDLWNALAETVKKWEQELPKVASLPEAVPDEDCGELDPGRDVHLPPSKGE